MANYTAADVKALREKSGAGMMDCKSALDEAEGNVEKAMEVLRLKGLKGVTKREGRTTSNGLIVARVNGGTGYLSSLLARQTSLLRHQSSSSLPTRLPMQLLQRARPHLRLHLLLTLVARPFRMQSTMKPQSWVKRLSCARLAR